MSASQILNPIYTYFIPVIMEKVNGISKSKVIEKKKHMKKEKPHHIIFI
jgi:hypothetical protein